MDQPTCPLSHDPMRPWLTIPCDHRRCDDGQSFELFWCDACAFGQLHPRPTPAEIATYYDVPAYYTHAHGATAAAEGDTPPGLRDRLLRRAAWQFDHGSSPRKPSVWSRIVEAAGESCCEIGCGSGEKLQRLRTAGVSRVVGVEPDPKAREEAERRGIVALDGTAEHLPDALAGERFDLVVMFHALEHTLDPVLAVENATSLLKPGGAIVIETPNNACLHLDIYRNSWTSLDVPRHLNFFTASSLHIIGERAGLKAERVEYHGYTRQFFTRLLDLQGRIQQLFDDVECRQRGRTQRTPRPNPWAVLLRTAFAPAERKYDSVRVWFTPASPTP